jgi:hypothetical protein
MRKILTVEERIEFYKGVTERLMERIKNEGLQPDVDVADDDYDGGRFDYLTSRGVK